MTNVFCGPRSRPEAWALSALRPAHYTHEKQASPSSSELLLIASFIYKNETEKYVPDFFFFDTQDHQSHDLVLSRPALEPELNPQPVPDLLYIIIKEKIIFKILPLACRCKQQDYHLARRNGTS